MKKTYVTPEVECINFYSEEDITELSNPGVDNGDVTIDPETGKDTWQ